MTVGGLLFGMGELLFTELLLRVGELLFGMRELLGASDVGGSVGAVVGNLVA